MKEIVSMQKKALKAAEVKYLYVPFYDTLSIKKMIEFASSFDGVDLYFPLERDIPALPR